MEQKDVRSQKWLDGAIGAKLMHAYWSTHGVRAGRR
jgi:hypothetical protein